MIPVRNQQTIARPAVVRGRGFLTGRPVVLRFQPAEAGAGIAFRRTDLRGAPEIPALVEYTAPRQRRTTLDDGGVQIEMIEHVMAALAGLQIDNVCVELDAVEPPGGDGSSGPFVEALLDAGIVAQNRPRPALKLSRPVRVATEDGLGGITAAPSHRHGLTLAYTLDFGPKSPIAPQHLVLDLTANGFRRELANCRTFLLEAEARALQAEGVGVHLTPHDLLVFGRDGLLENSLRSPAECARHKMLDCVGDLALLGCDLHGQVTAVRSGHRQNADLVRALRCQHGDAIACEDGQALWSGPQRRSA